MTPAPAKINLGLHVLRRRADGYHDIRTVFVRIGWSDSIRVERAEGLHLVCSDPALPTDDRNLCIRAAIALRKAANRDPGARIVLEKRIPYGAGLGGGSSDAATTLALLNELWDLNLPVDELADIGSSIGSDVPFFLFRNPIAVGEGRGEILRPLRGENGEPFRLAYPVCVVVPHISVPTEEAYRLVQPRAEKDFEDDLGDIESVVRTNDLFQWSDALVNDFERPVLARWPEIAAVRQMLLDAGAGYAALSGSGSAVFGVFEEEADCRAASDAAALAGHRTWWGRAMT